MRSAVRNGDEVELAMMSFEEARDKILSNVTHGV